jgi:hypothetical protein
MPLPATQPKLLLSAPFDHHPSRPCIHSALDLRLKTNGRLSVVTSIIISKVLFRAGRGLRMVDCDGLTRRLNSKGGGMS